MKPHHDKKKWNIIFLIYAELADAASQDNGGADGVNVAADLAELKKNILDINTSQNFNLITIENNVRIKDMAITSDIIQISRLVFDPEKKVNIQELLDTPDIRNFAQNPRDIASVFRCIDNEYPAEKNLLVTWDHGSAFGIFKKVLKDQPSVSPVDSTVSTTENDLFQILSESKVGGVGVIRILKNKRPIFSISSGDKPLNPMQTNPADFTLLSNDDLRKAILNGFASKCVNVLLMFNCDMLNMHTCYALRNCVNYLVAPEGVISAPGYNYKAIADLIRNNEVVDDERIAASAVNDFKKNYSGYRAPAVQKIAIFAVHLENYEDKVIKTFNGVIARLEKMMQEPGALRRDLKAIRKHSFEFGLGRPLSYFFVDFNNYLQDVNDGKTNEMLKNLEKDLYSATKSVTLCSAIGKQVYVDTLQPGNFEQKKHRVPTGLTIYFPSPIPSNLDPLSVDFLVPGAPYSSSLLTDTKWMGFLAKLFKTKVPSGQ